MDNGKKLLYCQDKEARGGRAGLPAFFKEKNMKRILFVAAVLLSASTLAFADGRIVSAESLSRKEMDFISANFPGATIELVESDWGELEVWLSDGTEIDFDRGGDWDLVKSRASVPAALLPAEAADYISASYPGTGIVEIDKDWNSYEVKLANGWELHFGRDGNLRGRDFDD